MMEWLLAPIDAGRAHDLDLYQAWHGRLMVLAWAFLFPLGILAARFFKITPRQDWPNRLDNPFWWHLHRLTQYVGGVAVIIALVLIEPSGLTPLNHHAAAGWLVIVLCVVQFLSAWLRGSKGGPTDPAPDGSLRGDHFDMTLRRRIFERVHKVVGYIAILLALGVTGTGLWTANAPVWIWLAIALWWCLLGAAFVRLQRMGRAVDTYQAIWGPDENLPGNTVKPIGWGIVRPGKERS